MLTSHVCIKCTLGLVALEKAEIDLHAFKQRALSSLTAIKLTRLKVTSGEVGVSLDTVRARPIKIKENTALVKLLSVQGPIQVHQLHVYYSIFSSTQKS